MKREAWKPHKIRIRDFKSIFFRKGCIYVEKSKNYFEKVVVLCVLSLILAGCGFRKSSSMEISNLTDSLLVLDKEPESHTVEIKNLGIYLDVTPSMSGFLGIETAAYKELVPETKYELCLNEVDKIIAGKFSTSQGTYYRVDTPLWKTKENVLKEGRKSKYYKNSEKIGADYEKVDLIEDDGEGYDSRCLTNALLNCIEDDFSILITDFYENNGEASEVINALKQNMMEMGDEDTIGIIGIRSEYSGTVRDLDFDGRKEEFGIIEDKNNIKAEDICYRQFYVIVIGQVEKVSEFCENIQGSMNLSTDYLNYTVFYEEKLYSLDFTDFEKCPSTSKDGNWQLWSRNDILINNKYPLNVYDYCDKKEEKKDIVVGYKVSGEVLKNELKKGKKYKKTLRGLPEMQLIEVDFDMKTQEVSGWNKDNQCFEEDDNLREIFSVEEVYYSDEKDELYVVFKIKEKISEKKILRLKGELYFEVQEQLITDWVLEWNQANGENSPGKTKDLVLYIDAIKDEMPHRNNLLLDFTFYLNSL